MAQIKNYLWLTACMAALCCAPVVSGAAEENADAKDSKSTATTDTQEKVDPDSKTDQADKSGQSGNPTETSVADARKKQFVEMERKRKERYTAMFHKLDTNDDKKLSFDEFLNRFSSVKAISDKPIYERQKNEQNRLVQLEKSFRTKIDGDGNGSVNFHEFMTNFYKPMRAPAAVAAEKADAAARRDAAQAKRDQSAVQREIAKRERDRKAAIKAQQNAQDARDKTLDRPKADRNRDE